MSARKGEESQVGKTETAASEAVTIASDDVARAADKRRRAALGEPGWREQNELDALLVERRGFVQRGKDTTHIDAEIRRRGGQI